MRKYQPCEDATLSSRSQVLRDKLDHIMDTLDVTQIPSSVSRDTVDAAVALGGGGGGGRFSRTYSMTTDAKEQVRLFRAARVELAKLPQIALTSVMQLISPSVVPHVNPAGTLKKIAAQWHYKAFAQNHNTLDDQVRAAQVDIIVLAVMGFLVYDKGQVQLAEYKVDSEGFVRAAKPPDVGTARWSWKIFTVGSRQRKQTL